MPRSVVACVLLQFVDECDAADTRDYLLQAFTRSMNQLGFDRVNVSLMRDFDMPDDEMGFGLINSYPEDWQKYYVDKDCVRFDPVAQCARGYISPFFWKNIAQITPLNGLQTSFLNLAEEAGLCNGIGLPFTGPQTLIGGVALATSTPTDEHLKDLNLLWSFSSLLYRRWREIAFGRRGYLGLHSRLTDREIDILRLSTSGKSDREVGFALTISENTVNTHLRNIYRKLNANSRVQAFSNAVKMGIISPT